MYCDLLKQFTTMPNIQIHYNWATAVLIPSVSCSPLLTSNTRQITRMIISHHQTYLKSTFYGVIRLQNAIFTNNLISINIQTHI